MLCKLANIGRVLQFGDNYPVYLIVRLKTSKPEKGGWYRDRLHQFARGCQPTRARSDSVSPCALDLFIDDAPPRCAGTDAVTFMPGSHEFQNYEATTVHGLDQ